MQTVQKGTQDIELIQWADLVKPKLVNSDYAAVAALIELKPDGSKVATIINPYENSLEEQLQNLNLYIHHKQILALVFFNRKEQVFWGKIGLEDQLHQFS